MTMPKHFLLCLWDGGGNLPPALSVARALVARGHTVTALADRVLAGEVTAAGAEHVEWTRAPQRLSTDPATYLIHDLEARTPLGEFARGRDGLLVGPAADFAADVVEELRRRPADVVLADMFLLGAFIGAEAAGVPRAVLSPNLLALPGWGVPPIGPGLAPARGPLGRGRDRVVGTFMTRLFDRALPTLNAARASHGLPPVGSVLDELVGADLVLLMTSPAFEYPGFAPPANVRFTGPRLDDPAWAGGWSPAPGDAPLVLASLTTTYMAQEPVLERIAAALGTLPVRGLVTTGPNIDPATIDAPANVMVVASAPHSAVLPHAAAVVTHAGHGTVIKALAAGRPVLAMPMGRDQLDNAARVQHHGAGLRLAPKAGPAKIARAVRRLLDEPAFAESARRQAAAIAEVTREDRTVAALEALAGARTREAAALV
jgi:MGT family glycosyltransferase